MPRPNGEMTYEEKKKASGEVRDKLFPKLKGSDWSEGPNEFSIFGADDDQVRAANEQITAYKDQTEINKEALADAKEQRETEKRRVEEKQIRSLRNRGGRSASLMTVGQPASNNTLGGGLNLPNKLGTA
jgi:hypothetical protein